MQKNGANSEGGVVLSTSIPRGRRFRRPQAIQTSLEDTNYDGRGVDENTLPCTPLTISSSSSSQPALQQDDNNTPSGLRGRSDLRSPGAPKSPTAVVIDSTPIPDFITQTDKYGRATTPRSPQAINAARDNETAPFDEDKIEETSGGDEVDACDSLLENLRMMCCCLLVDVSNASPGSVGLDGLTSPHAQTTKSTKVAYATKKDKSPRRQRRNCANDKNGDRHTLMINNNVSLIDNDCDKIKLLPNIHPDDVGKKCLVLDLDETLVHSSFRAVVGADFVIPVQIEDVVHFVYVSKRPGVDEFLTEMAKHYEVIVYTASLNKYADPLLDLLDPQGTIRVRLFRESCVYHEGNYVKDLSRLDRDLSQAIIIDNSPSSYIFHPENAIDCTSYIDDAQDRELHHIASFLRGIRQVDDVRKVCNMWRQWPGIPHVEGVIYPHESAYDADSSNEEKKSDVVT